MSPISIEQEKAELVRKLAAECTLFLKRDGSFPLEKPCTIALFGNGARNTVRGGTGSGEVYSRNVVNIEDGLKNSGFAVTSGEWLCRYDAVRADAHEKWVRDMKKKHRGIKGISAIFGSVMPEPEYELPLDYPGEACIYVLSRISGEGSDRVPERGSILLSKTEVRDILALNSSFEKFLLVLNVGGPVDLSEIGDVRNILLLSQVGPSSGNILADILLGRADPCGKLATTWAKWDDYCRMGEFGKPGDIRYLEGIYVGYRYFDTVGKKALYPFGFGLSYTDFLVSGKEVSVDGSKISVTAEVKNTGRTGGREVVQVYVSVPGGRLDQPYQALAAFCKTEPVEPGACTELSLSFDLRDLASYDEESSCYILEAGKYVVRVGDSSVNAKPVAVIDLGRTVVVKRVRNTLGDCGFKDWRPEAPERTLPDGVPRLKADPDSFAAEEIVYGTEGQIDPWTASLTDEELCRIGVGDYSSDPLSIVGNNSSRVAGAAGDLTTRLESKGLPAVVTADGPAGLRLEREYYKDSKGLHNVHNDGLGIVSEFLPGFLAKILTAEKKIKPGTKIYQQNCTMIPTATAIAQSFDPALAEKLGSIVGEEMERYGVTLWLAPALNIHRDIRCGRNFEYYSEDPLVSGKMAAAVVKGVQSHAGCFATIKHFAANNQETDRYSSNSLVSERAMREIYLKGFEICIREAHPGAVMTSYNLLNGIHTASHKGLVGDVLRCEFGFDGVVMTDWIIRMTMSGGKYELPLSWQVAAAGGDVFMPGSRRDYTDLLKGLKAGKVSRKQLEINASRIYRFALNKKENRHG